MHGFFEEIESRVMFSVGSVESEVSELPDASGAINMDLNDIEDGAGENSGAAVSTTPAPSRHHGHHHGHHHHPTTPTPVPTPTPTPTPVAGLPNLVGNYNGILNIPSVGHYKNAVLSIATQSSKGTFGGTLVADGLVSVNVSGVVSAKRTFSISVVTPANTNHPGGPINGTGTGTLDSTGKVLAINLNFSAYGSTLPGTLSVTKA